METLKHLVDNEIPTAEQTVNYKMLTTLLNQTLMMQNVWQMH